jgi:hypothetical protein
MSYVTEEEINDMKIGFESLSQPTFPSTIVLLITTHGEIRLFNDHTPVTFTMPEGLKIIHSSSSNVGECNYVNKVDTEKYAKIIQDNMSGILNPAIQQGKIKIVTDLIRESDMRYIPHIKEKIKQFKKRPLENKQNIIEYEGYYYGFDRSHMINVFVPGDKVVNKFYTRVDSTADKYDFTIKVMNLPGEPDLLAYLFRQRRGNKPTDITLASILRFLYNKGVENIIIFDTSCSVMNTMEGYLEPRSVRQVRRKEFYSDINSMDENKRLKSMFGGRRRTNKKYFKRRTRSRRRSRTMRKNK